LNTTKACQYLKRKSNNHTGLTTRREVAIIRLIVPIPPSVNHLYRNARIKNRIIPVYTQSAIDWRTETILLAKNWANLNQWQMAEGKVIVRLWFYFPDRRKRDTHNTLKALMDALEESHIYENDRYALPHIMNYEVDKENPRVELEFEMVEVTDL